jgi:hypothetical protein
MLFQRIVAAEQHPGRRGDQDQVRRGEERGRVDRVAQKLAVQQGDLAHRHLGHPPAADHRHVGVDDVLLLAQALEHRLVEQPAEQEEGQDDQVDDRHGQELLGQACESEEGMKRT